MGCSPCRLSEPLLLGDCRGLGGGQEPSVSSSAEVEAKLRAQRPELGVRMGGPNGHGIRGEKSWAEVKTWTVQPESHNADFGFFVVCM